MNRNKPKIYSNSFGIVVTLVVMFGICVFGIFLIRNLLPKPKPVSLIEKTSGPVAPSLPTPEPESKIITNPSSNPSANASIVSISITLRQHPNFNSPIVATATRNEPIEVIKQENGWFQVKYNGQLGWLTGNNFQFYKSEVKETRKVAPVIPAPTSSKEPSDFYSFESYSTPQYSPRVSNGYIRGPRGGCYYINRNGNKTYVDRSLCN